MRNIILILCFGILTSFISTQSTEWTTINIDGFGSIGLPPNMEIQGGAYKDFIEKGKAISGINASQVIFQQKNLNELNQGSFNTYARVFINTEKSGSGDFKGMNEGLNELEANEINTEFRKKVESEAVRGNYTVLEWHKAIITKLNNINAIQVGYKRKIGYNNPVLIEIFLIQNNDRFHKITFEYRIDNINWRPTFEELKTTVKISKK